MAQKGIASGQRDEIGRIAEAAAKKAVDELDLDHAQAQAVIEKAGELKRGVKELLSCLCVREDYADEEVSSSYEYPSEYTGPKPIAEQVATLRQLFPELKGASFDETIAARPLPSNAEGWFAIPRWEKLGSSYGKAVEKVLAAIKSKRTFHNYREGQAASQYLRQQAKTVEAFQKLGDEQKGHDILIVPCQFGLRYRGKSVRRARVVMNVNEFGLGAFAVGAMLLTHPERLVCWKQLHVDCAGDEFAPDADGQFVSAPFFSWGVGRVGFGTDDVDDTSLCYGSASGFLPQ